MEDLMMLNDDYSIEKADGEGFDGFVLHSSDAVQISDAIYDVQAECLVLAVKCVFRGGIDYVYLNGQGLQKALQEPAGIMPNLFFAPDKSLWVRLSADTEKGWREVVLPLEERGRIGEKTKAAREFASDEQVYWEGDTYWISRDSFDKKKPDRLCKFTFTEKGVYNKRSIEKLPFPKDNEMWIGEDGLHLLSVDRETDRMTHRLLNSAMETERQVECIFPQSLFNHMYPLNLSFDQPNRLLMWMNNELRSLLADQNGEIVEDLLLTAIPHEEGFRYVWKPVWLSEEEYIVRFTYALGSGFAAVRGDKVLCFYLKETGQMEYRNLMGEGILDSGCPQHVGLKILPCGKGAFYMVFGDTKQAMQTNILYLQRIDAICR